MKSSSRAVAEHIKQRALKLAGRAIPAEQSVALTPLNGRS